MEELSVYMTGARELDRTEWGTIVCVCVCEREEGHKGVKKKRREKEWQQTKKNQGGRRGWGKRGDEGVEKEEAKQQRSEREMTWGVEGCSERWIKWERERKVSRQWRRKKESERQWKQWDSGGERKREGRMSPMAATHHSQLNDAVFFFFSFPPFSRFFFCGREGWGRELGARRPIKRGHTEFTSSRWDRAPPGRCLHVAIRIVWPPGDSFVEDILRDSSKHMWRGLGGGEIVNKSGGEGWGRARKDKEREEKFRFLVLVFRASQPFSFG